MHWLRNLPIRHKLIFISLLTSGVVLLLACAAFLTHERLNFRQSMSRDLSITADMIGLNSTAALSFQDSGAAQQTLHSLNAHPQIVAACIFDSDGEVFATYSRDGFRVDEWPQPRADEDAVVDDHLELFRKIRFGGESLGVIFLRSDLTQLGERLKYYASVASLVLIASILLAWLLAARLQRVISTPILNLASVAGRVANGAALSIRAEKRGDDELGRLTDDFNSMLARIEAQDISLRNAHHDLEKRVEERTAELKQVQEEAEAERSRLKFIFECVPVGISLITWTVRQEYSALVNDAHRRICGLTRKDSEDPFIFKRLTHPEDRERQDAFQERLEAGEIDRYSLEKRYIKPDGEIVWVVFSTTRMNYPDGRVENLTTITDITDLKHAQEEAAREHSRFRFIFNSLPVGVAWMIRGQRESRIVNPAFCRISGVPMEHSQDLSRYAKATHPDDLAAQAKLHQRVVDGEIDSYHLEKRYRAEDGVSYRWAQLVNDFLREKDNESVQELTTLIDITERKHAEEELAKTHGRLLDVSRQAGMAEVATSVLHNVGNVLNSVNVSATLLDDRARRSKSTSVGKVSALLNQHADDLATYLTEDPQGRQIPAFMESLAHRLDMERQDLLQDLKSLRANVDHIKEIVAMQQSYAKVSGVTETLSVIDMVEDALRMNSDGFERHGIELKREFQSQPVITVERHKVLQILVNVLRNAKQACDERGRTDKSVTVRVASSNGRHEISVIDNGVGIAKDTLTRIFGHGFTTRSDGHGFGLHSGALAAKEMGGALRVHSDGLGTGATFVLELPDKVPAKAS